MLLPCEANELATIVLGISERPKKKSILRPFSVEDKSSFFSSFAGHNHWGFFIYSNF
jgi:hypothetical protein